MEEGANNSNGWQFTVALAALTLLFIIIGGYFFRLAFLHYETLGAGGLWQLSYLFGLPLLGQLVSFWAMFSKAKRDSSVLLLYSFYLVTNLIATAFCYWLWSEFPGGGDHSTLALFIIHLLLLPVGLMTYIIMWTPYKGVLHSASRLHEKDIINCPKLCERLHSKSEESSFNPHKVILRLIHLETHCDIVNAAKGTRDFTKVSRDKVVEDLNNIIPNQDFHQERELANVGPRVEDAKEFQSLRKRSHRPLTDREVQRLNRLLLEACFPEIERKQLSRWDKAVMLRERVFAALKDGVSKTPFWAVVFFFTVFLGITYLFGFSFAFHDREVGKTGRAALFMDESIPADGTLVKKTVNSGAPQASPSPSPSQSPASSPSPSPSPSPSTFYFASNSADFDRKYLPVGKTNDKEELSKEWRAKKNIEHLQSLIKSIEDGTENGNAVRVRIIGETDKEPVGRDEATTTKYASNYELSEARAQNVKYVLMSRFSTGEDTRRKVEWLCLPQSSEPINPPLEQREGEEDEKRREEQQAAAKTTKARQNQDISETTSRLNTLTETVNRSLSANEVLISRLSRIARLLNSHKLSPDAARKVIDKVDDMIKVKLYPPPSPPQTNQGQVEVFEQHRAAVDEILDYVDYVDEKAQKRVVNVFIEPVVVSHGSRELSLLDYMYFTIYTITTTGYGDIVPTTPYAKYLCSLANVLEVFFFVVFFNALLTVRESRSGRFGRDV